MATEEFDDRIIFMSMFYDIDWSKGEENSNICFTELLEGQRRRKKVSEGTLVFSRSWWWRKKVWNERLQTWRKVEWKSDVVGLHFEDSGHPVFRTSGALDRGYLRKNGGTHSFHFNGDTSECRSFVSHNKFSHSAQYSRSSRKHREIDRECEWTVGFSYGARRSEYPNENTWVWFSSIKKSIVWPPREIRKFDERNESDSSLSWEKLLLECFQTIHDIDDGFGGESGACREYTRPRDHDDSKLVAWIRGFTKIGPVIQVRATYYSDQNGHAIQVNSMLNNESNRNNRAHW